MPFQIWDFLPPSDPQEPDLQSGIDFWESIACGTEPVQPARLESYLSKLLDAAPMEWRRRMQYTILRHFKLAEPGPETYQAQRSLDTRTVRIRSISPRLGGPC